VAHDASLHRSGGELIQLQRLVLDFRKGELVVRCLYRTQAGPVVNAGGARTLIAWDTIAILELVND